MDPDATLYVPFFRLSDNRSTLPFRHYIVDMSTYGHNDDMSGTTDKEVSTRQDRPIVIAKDI